MWGGILNHLQILTICCKRHFTVKWDPNEISLLMMHLHWCFSWFLYNPADICRRPYWRCSWCVNVMLIQRLFVGLVNVCPLLITVQTILKTSNNFPGKLKSLISNHKSMYGVDQIWHTQFNSCFTLEDTVLITFWLSKWIIKLNFWVQV